MTDNFTTDDIAAEGVEWPDEIWAEDRHEGYTGIYRLSVFGTVDQPFEHARYVHHGLYDGLQKYHDAMVAQLRAQISAIMPNDEVIARLGPIADLLPDAVAAAEKAMRKFPQPNYVISKWAEETGEVTKAAIHMAEGRETPENLRGEIVQSLAMLHRLLVEGDQVHGLPPVKQALAEAKAVAK